MTTQGDATRARILDAIRAHCADYGYSPTLAEVAAVVGISTQATQKQIKTLAHWGQVKRTPGMARSVEVVE